MSDKNFPLKDPISKRFVEELNQKEKFFKQMYFEKWDGIPEHIEETFKEIEEEIEQDILDLEEEVGYLKGALKEAEKTSISDFLPETCRDLTTVLIVENIINNLHLIDVDSLEVIFGQ